jgi:uncharacterized C2H2 Zn-finger protein
MPDGDNPDPRLPATLRPPPAAPPPAPPPAPEALVVCPECRATFTPAGFSRHLRLAHGLYLFRGRRRPLADILDALLDALTTLPPDPEAWRELSAIAAEEHGARSSSHLTAALGRALARLEPDRRAAVVGALAPLAAQAGPRLAAALASDGEPAARHLALAVLAHLPQPLDPSLLPPLRALLLDRRLPSEAQLDALAAVLPSTGPDSPLTLELLEKLVTGLSKNRSLDRLQQLEQRAGKGPALAVLSRRIEDQLRMTCPRCDIELRRPDMVQHLWDEHRLVLDGRRVRDPWSVVGDWLDEVKPDNEAEMLRRCRVVALRADPEHGLLHLQRALLYRRLYDPEVRAELLRDAAEQHAARCPWCYALVPVPREVPPLTVYHAHGWLAGDGYRVEVSERGLRTSLEVRTPDRLLYGGPEPQRRWTPGGATLLLVGPILLLALACACGLTDALAAPLWPVAGLLAVALVVYLLVRADWRTPAPDERALTYAWTLLAPRLHAGSFVPEDSAFLAGLARISSARHASLRAALLPGLLRRTENALAGGAAPPGHLAALRRLLIEDLAEAGEDPVPLVVEQLDRCFRGRLPLAFAERLLDGWEAGWWTRGNLARLRILLCDRAFEAGFEVRNLLDAGQNAPSLGAVLRAGDPFGLACLRLLWSLRPTRPWDRCGAASTAFELAADPEQEALLDSYPDLLLRQEEPDWIVVADGGKGRMGPAHILFCARGVVLQDVLFTDPPQPVEINRKSVGYELVMGNAHFRSPGPVDDLALRMERWFRYAFHEFRPAVTPVQAWKAPDRAAILRSWGAVPCPECHRNLLPRVGDAGIPLDEATPG